MSIRVVVNPETVVVATPDGDTTTVVTGGTALTVTANDGAIATATTPQGAPGLDGVAALGFTRPDLYGAMGDASNNDTAGFLGAFNAITDQNTTNALYADAGEGGIVWARGGVYDLYGPVDIERFKGLAGLGKGVTTFRCQTADAMIRCNTAGTSYPNNRGPSIGGFTIDCNYIAATGLFLGRGAERSIYDVDVIHATAGTAGVHAGIVLAEAQNYVLTNVNSQINDGDGLLLTNGAGGNLFNRCEFNSCGRFPVHFGDTPYTNTNQPPSDNTFVQCIIERSVATTQALIRGEAGKDNRFIASSIADGSPLGTVNPFPHLWLTKGTADMVSDHWQFMACRFQGNSDPTVVAGTSTGVLSTLLQTAGDVSVYFNSWNTFSNYTYIVRADESVSEPTIHMEQHNNYLRAATSPAVGYIYPVEYVRTDTGALNLGNARITQEVRHRLVQYLAGTAPTQDYFYQGFRSTPTGTGGTASPGVAEAFHRIGIRMDGRLEWGAGTITRDVVLYRADANVLKTDDQFVSATPITIAAGAFTNTTGALISTTNDGRTGGWTLPPGVTSHIAAPVYLPPNAGGWKIDLLWTVKGGTTTSNGWEAELKLDSIVPPAAPANATVYGPTVISVNGIGTANPQQWQQTTLANPYGGTAGGWYNARLIRTGAATADTYGVTSGTILIIGMALTAQ